MEHSFSRERLSQGGRASSGTSSSGRGATVYLNVYDLLQQASSSLPAAPAARRRHLRRRRRRSTHAFVTILQNDWTYWCGVGVFHSGVEVYGVEYAFGGGCASRLLELELPLHVPNRARRPCQPMPTAPLCAGHEYDMPGVFATNPREAPGTVAWREAVPVGHTDLTQVGPWGGRGSAGRCAYRGHCLLCGTGWKLPHVCCRMSAQARSLCLLHLTLIFTATAACRRRCTRSCTRWASSTRAIGAGQGAAECVSCCLPALLQADSHLRC